MARARILKPGFFKNEELSALPFEARLCFQGLWLLCDRAGRLEDRPRRIKAELFPYDDIQIDAILTELDKSSFIIRYAVGGDRFIAIPNFLKHQHPHVREPESLIPEPIPSTNIALDQTSAGIVLDRLDPVTRSGYLDPDPVTRSGSCDPDPVKEQIHDRGFAAFWLAYPKRVGKGAAEKAWKRIGPKNGLNEHILAAVEKQKTTPQWQKNHGQFIPHPATWLNQTRWEDDTEVSHTSDGLSDRTRRNLESATRAIAKVKGQ